MMSALRLAGFGLACMIMLSSLTRAPDTQSPTTNAGLAIQQLDLAHAIAGIQVPTLFILFVLIALPAGYWLSVRRRIQQKHRHR